jgi:uncharacterized protein YxjI
MKIKKLFMALFVVMMSLVAAESSFAQTDKLEAGGTIEKGRSLYSITDRYKLTLQADGNLVLLKMVVKSDSRGKTQISGGTVLWNSQTAGRDVENAVMQADGNFVLYAPDGKAVWNTKTHKYPGSVLKLQTDGNLVIYNAQGKAVWNTGTNGK